MADVFISYHRSDGASALVRRIADELESMGISCWYDTKDPDPGYFVQTIEQEILRCKVFLLIWDEGANNSEWCLTETYTAFNGANHAVRVPFKIGAFQEHDEMRFYMRRLQSFNGGDFPENANIKELITKIAVLLGKTSVKIVDNGSCGDNVIYELDEKGILTISGRGDMDLYPDNKNAPWWYKRGLISVARIQKGVTSIGAWAFSYCNNLIDVTIPNSVVSIGYDAFAMCKSLTSVAIPNNLTSIEAWAFFHCDSLPSITIPDSVTSIEKGAFRYCYSLQSVTIPDSVTSIEEYTFADCNSLTSVTIPDSVTSIDVGAFWGCDSLKSVSVPANAEIADGAFPETTEIILRE